MDFGGSGSLWGNLSGGESLTDGIMENGDADDTNSTEAKWDVNDFMGEDGDLCCAGNSVKCSVCGMEFAFPGILEVHLSKMHNVTPVPSCKSCNMVFRRVMGLINHWRTGVPHVRDRGGLKLLGCDICDAFNIINGFRDKDDVAEHTRAVHGESVLIDSSNQEKPLCPLCQRGFTYRKGVIEHIQILHGEHLVVDLIGARNQVDKQKLLNELQYRCHYCAKTFRVKKSLLQHLEKFHNDTTGYTQPRPGSPQSNFKAHSVKGGSSAQSDEVPLSPSNSSSSAMEAATSSHPSPSTKGANRPIGNGSGHVSSSAGGSPAGSVTCQTCGKSFTRQSVLSVHDQMVHGAPSRTARSHITPHPLLAAKMLKTNSGESVATTN